MLAFNKYFFNKYPDINNKLTIFSGKKREGVGVGLLIDINIYS